MTQPAARKITYRPLAELTPNPRNPKQHDLDLIDSSIGRFGVIDPVVLDGRTGQLIGGHGRTDTLRLMEKRGDNPPDGVRVNAKGQWTVPVVTGWSSRTDAEASAALIALNRSTELGGWVDESLLALLDDLAETEDGFTGVGFDETDLDDLRARLEEVATADDSTNTMETPSLAEYAERYEEQGRRLIVLDYGKDDYALITVQLKRLRERTGADNNSTALLDHLAGLFPEVSAEELAEAADGPVHTLDGEFADPAATL